MRIRVAAIVVLLLSGCEAPSRLEATAPTTESGRVSKLVYVPSGHGSDTAVGYNFGKGGGMTLTPIDVNIPARYGIVFECQHGSFAIEGRKWEALWKSLREGQEVEISYRTVYSVKSGQTSDVKTFFKLDFLGATPFQHRTGAVPPKGL